MPCSITATLAETEKRAEESDARASESAARLMDATETLAKLTSDVGALTATRGELQTRVTALEAALASARDVESTMSRELAALREASGTSESSQLDRVTSVTREAERLKQRLRDAQAQLARLGATEGLGECLREHRGRSWVSPRVATETGAVMH